VRRIGKQFRAWVFAPVRAWTMRAEQTDEYARNAWQEARVRTGRATDGSRMFELWELLVVAALSTGAGFWASGCEFVTLVQVALILLAAIAGWLLAPLGWACGVAVLAPRKQRDAARRELVQVRNAWTPPEEAQSLRAERDALKDEVERERLRKQMIDQLREDATNADIRIAGIKRGVARASAFNTSPPDPRLYAAAVDRFYRAIADRITSEGNEFGLSVPWADALVDFEREPPTSIDEVTRIDESCSAELKRLEENLRGQSRIHLRGHQS
jgi:hypothetical protein